MRYVYAVAAVDTAKNTSGPSNRVEEGAIDDRWQTVATARLASEVVP